MTGRTSVIDVQSLDRVRDLDSEELALISTVRRLVQDVVVPMAGDVDRTEEFPQTWLDALSDIGALYLKVPVSYGGSGPVRDATYMRVLEELAYGSLAAATLLANVSGYAEPILKGGTDRQKDILLSRLVSSRMLGGFGLTEAESGSDAKALRTTASEVEGGFVINGSKMFITGLSRSDMMVVFARDGKGITAFVVDVAAEGVAVSPPLALLGMHGIPNVSVSFSGVYVDEGAVLGERGHGLALALESLNSGRLAVAAQACGIARAAVDDALSYARQRHVFGRPVVDFQGIRFEIAEAVAAIDAARSMVHDASQALQMGVEATRLCSGAKFFASDMAMRVCSKALEWFGGYGYTKDYPAERHFRDAKLLQLFAGTNHIQKLVTARAVLGS